MSLIDEICPRPPDYRIDWTAIEGVVDRGAMEATAQGAQYHAEGDVWIHTGMVCAALIALPGWRAVNDGERAIVFAAALLHDLGKPATTRHEPDGRISSRGHSGRGEHRAHDDTRSEVIVMVGLPAAGKDAWLARSAPGWRRSGSTISAPSSTSIRPRGRGRWSRRRASEPATTSGAAIRSPGTRPTWADRCAAS